MLVLEHGHEQFMTSYGGNRQWTNSQLTMLHTASILDSLSETPLLITYLNTSEFFKIKLTQISTSSYFSILWMRKVLYG